MTKVLCVEPLEDFEVFLKFSNGEQRVVDLAPLLRGPIFEPVKNASASFAPSALMKSLERLHGATARTSTPTCSTAPTFQRGWKMKKI